MVVEAEFLLREAEETLKIRVSQEGNGDDISAPMLADVDGEMSLGNAVVGGGGSGGVLLPA